MPGRKIYSVILSLGKVDNFEEGGGGESEPQPEIVRILFFSACTKKFKMQIGANLNIRWGWESFRYEPYELKTFKIFKFYI